MGSIKFTSYVIYISGGKTGFLNMSANSSKRGATNRGSMPRIIGVDNTSCLTPGALLSPTDRQEAASYNRKYHASPRPY